VPSEVELRTLQRLVTEKSVSELSEDLEYSLSYTSEVVSKLEKKGLVDTRKEGRQRLVSLSESKATELYRKLVQSHSHVDWAELLSRKAVEILDYLDEPVSVSELAEKTDNYRATVHRILDRFLKRGIVQEEWDSQYRLNENFLTVNDFSKEYFHQIHREITSSNLLIIDTQENIQFKLTFQDVENYGSESYDILWETPYTFLLSTNGSLHIENPDFHLTGPERFQDYGIELITTDRRHYFYSEDIDEVSPQELVCHTLLIDDGTRYRTYCLLLIEKEGIHEEVLEVSEKYGIEELVNSLLRYIEGEDSINMPERTEFESAARKYGVDV
jgi:DNA-binding MarR family transcriptional regulator